MKKVFALLLALTMIVGLAACGSQSAPAATQAPAQQEPAPQAETAADPYADLAPVELISADSTSKGAAGQVFQEYVAKRVAEITGGKLTIDYHPNSELGGDADILRQVQSGDIDISLCQTAPVVSFIPEVAVFDLPMVFSKYDGDTINKVLNGDGAFHTQLSEAYNKAGFELLGFLQNATYRLTTANTALNTLEDFKHLQIRTMQNANHMAFWTAIGAEPTPLAWPEVYQALQTGNIDAQENAADTCVGANFQEVQKYLACTNHILYLNQICINADSFNALDPAYQAALRQAVADAIDYMRPQLADIDKNNKQILVDGGMTLIEYDAAFYDSILNLDGVKELYNKIDSDVGGLGTALRDELQAS